MTVALLVLGIIVIFALIATLILGIAAEDDGVMVGGAVLVAYPAAFILAVLAIVAYGVL